MAPLYTGYIPVYNERTIDRTLTLAAAFDLDRLGSAGTVGAFVVNGPTLSSDLPRSVVERPDDETKVQVFAETLKTGLLRFWHFLSG